MKTTKLRTVLLLFLISVTLFLFSGSVFAEESTNTQQVSTGTITISVEKFTLGEGYYVEPCQIPIYSGDTGITVLNRFLGENKLRWKANYLQGVYGAQAGTVNVPACISAMESHADFGAAPTTASAMTEGLTYSNQLSEKDYSPMSGWMYSVNNTFLGYGFDGYKPVDGDVLRVQFTLWGYGADLGQNFQGGMTPINTTDKTNLTALLGEINSSPNKSQYMKDSTFSSLYNQAYAMMMNLEATNKQIKDMYTNLKAAIPAPANLESVNCTYRTHVQDVGWQDWKSNGVMSGTIGQSLRLEGIEVKLDDTTADLGIQYQTHIENIGWEDAWKSNGDLSGTTGRSLRLEAIRIQLTGGDADNYDIYYQVHAQNVGWMGWAKNGENSGTAGFAYRLEGIKIVVVPKGETQPDTTIDQAQAFISNN